MTTTPRAPWLIPATIGLVALILGIATGALVMRSLSPAVPTAGDNPADPGPPEASGPTPASVLVDRVMQEELRQRFNVTGRLQERKRAVIAAQVEGMLIDLPVVPGSVVEANQTVLARVEDVLVKLELRSAEAETAATLATLDQSRRDLGYLESLAKSTAARPKEVEDARATVAFNKARHEAAIARRDRIAEDLARVTVTAPFDAIVVAKRAEVGERVEVGQALVELVSRGDIDAVIDVPERIINQVRLDDEVEVMVDSLGQTVTGRVHAINPDGTGAARTYPVKIRLKDMEGMLKPGMSVVARLPLENATPRLTVPRDAIQNGPVGPVVWVSQGSEQGGPPVGMSIPVEILFGHGDRFAVNATPGPMAGMLRPGADVVVQGAERIFFPGHSLNIMTDHQQNLPAAATTPPTTPPTTTAPTEG